MTDRLISYTYHGEEMVVTEGQATTDWHQGSAGTVSGGRRFTHRGDEAKADILNELENRMGWGTLRIHTGFDFKAQAQNVLQSLGHEQKTWDITPAKWWEDEGLETSFNIPECIAPVDYLQAMGNMFPGDVNIEFNYPTFYISEK